MKIIAIANQKGGCGKTTTAINLSACLGRKNQRVLLLDMDPQGHASLGLGQQTSELSGLYEVINNETCLSDVILPATQQGLDLIPSTISLAAAEHLLSCMPERDRLLGMLLEQVENDYDYVIIDCPPSLGLLSINALLAADQVIMPVEMSLFSLDGIHRLRETIDMISAQYDLNIPFTLLPTMVDLRTRLTREFLEHIENNYKPEEISDIHIHHTVRLKEAVCNGTPIIDYAPNSIAANDYDQLADEVIAGTDRLATEELGMQIERMEQLKEGIPEDNWVQHNPLQQVILNYQRSSGDIQIAGDFNGWIPDKDVETHVSNDRLQKIFNIEPGRYEYRIIVDGVWQHDPNNPKQVENEIGGSNSLLQI
ncbi:MAG: AAA family ATPase [Gammaproteobacteria bacterium]|nr:AAA family ATPase [Gammaproteobacteria bacterium]